jgi:hypothetical protein
MPTPRFTEVPPPLEARVADSLFTQLNTVVGFGVAATDRLNSTINDKELTSRTTRAIVDAIRPGSTTFALLILLVVMMCFHITMIRQNTNRILRDHGHFQRDEGEDNGRVHED